MNRESSFIIFLKKSFLSSLIIITTAFVLSCSSSQNKLPESWTVDFFNNTGYTIYVISYSHSSNSNFYDLDLLGPSEVMINGSSRRFMIPNKNYPSSVIDFFARDEDGDTYEIRVNAAHGIVNLTLSNMR